jgi:pyridoxamine 5'-phosphate oxidase
VRRAQLDPDPLRQFAAWLDEARSAGVTAPETMTLATASREGRPSARQVLLKEFDEDGFVFYTGYESRKGRELTENPAAALLFHWQSTGRQVRVEGTATKVSRAESETYWRSRPLGSRLSAAVSIQSAPIASRRELEARVEELRAGPVGLDPPLPAHWGGYRLAPEVYEFWEHRDDRLHDRFRYRRVGTGWDLARLSP